MDGGVVRLILAAIAAVHDPLRVCARHGSDHRAARWDRAGVDPAHLAGTTRTTTKTNDQEEGDAVSCTNMTPYAFHTVRSALRGVVGD